MAASGSNDLREEILFGARCLSLHFWVQFGTMDFMLTCYRK